MRTYRLARFVAFLLFFVALIYFIAGVVVGAYLWLRGLGEGWGSGFAGWLSIPIFISTFIGALTLLLFGAVLYFLAAINTNLTVARQRGAFARPKSAPAPAETITVPVFRPAPPEPTVVVPSLGAATPPAEPPAVKATPPQVWVAPAAPEAAPAAPEPPPTTIAAEGGDEPPAASAAADEDVSPDLLAELPADDADAEAVETGFAGPLPGADQAARIASELAATRNDTPAEA